MAEENKESQDSGTPTDELDLSEFDGLSPDEIEKLMQEETSEGGGEEAKSQETATPDVDAALSRFGVSKDDLPAELRDNPQLLTLAVAWAEKREKDLQRGFTKATEELRGKYGDADTLFQDAQAFRVLKENERFQQWVTEVRAELEGRPVVNSSGVKETPPEHLKGEDLINWYVDRRLNLVLNQRGYDSRLDLVGQYINKHEVDLLRTRYGDSFDELRPQVEKTMRELGVGAERAYKLVQNERGVDIDAIRKEEREKILAKVNEHRQAKGATLTGSGVTGTKTLSARRDEEKSYDERYDEVMREVIAEIPLTSE